MPRRDGTGPMGMGAMTGRGAGDCKRFVSNSFGIGGFGYGRGLRRMFCATNFKQRDEKAFLNNQVEILETQLQQVKNRISELKEKDQ
mgnify:CR=1 FL=1